MYCLRLFTTIFTVNIVVCAMKNMFHLNWLLAIYVPIVMYGLRLFIVVLQELHCLPNCLHVCMIRV